MFFPVALLFLVGHRDTETEKGAWPLYRAGNIWPKGEVRRWFLFIQSPWWRLGSLGCDGGESSLEKIIP